LSGIFSHGDYFLNKLRVKAARLILSIALLGFWVKPLYSEERKDSINIIKALPVVYYTPETGFAAEAFAFYSFHLGKDSRKSNIRFFATYTQLKQYLFILPFQIYTNKEKYFIHSYNEYRFFPEYFYGIGNNTKSNIRTNYDFGAIHSQHKILKKILKNTYAGPHLLYQKFDVDFNKNDSLFLVHENIIGKENFSHFLGGIALMHDSRDHILFPQKGIFIEILCNYGIGQADGNKNSFGTSALDFRKYFRIKKRNVLASNILLQSSVGNVPFRIMPSLGGALNHRGYYMGRFRDQNSMLFQLEWRHSFPRKFGVALGSSLGNVGNTPTALFKNKLHPALGMGLRYKLSKNDETNIRFDVYITPDSHGFYLYFAEAF
jgi:hypothetical protein